MCFVGRERETKAIIRSLEQGENVIVTGKYGMGRTRLVKHVADITSSSWRFIFVDFSQTPAKVCQDMLSQLLSEKQFACRRSKHYKPNRFLVANLDLGDKRQLVFVLDNITKVSAQKLAFIRYLVESERFLLVVIVEAFLPEKEFLNLRRKLMPAQVITLRHLSVRESEILLRYFSDKYQLNWAYNDIKMRAHTLKGYPLGIRDVVTREWEHKRRK